MSTPRPKQKSRFPKIILYPTILHLSHRLYLARRVDSRIQFGLRETRLLFRSRRRHYNFKCSDIIIIAVADIENQKQRLSRIEKKIDRFNPRANRPILGCSVKNMVRQKKMFAFTKTKRIECVFEKRNHQNIVKICKIFFF